MRRGRSGDAASARPPQGIEAERRTARLVGRLVRALHEQDPAPRSINARQIIANAAASIARPEWLAATLGTEPENQRIPSRANDAARTLHRHITTIGPAALPWIVDALGTTDERRRHGIHSTPPTLASWVTARTLETLPHSQSMPRIADLACGGGAFLFAAGRWIRTNRPEIPAAEWVANLVGFDINPIAVAVARLVLAIEADADEAILQTLSHTIRTADALSENDEAKIGNQPFDVILGNPPFRSPISEPGEMPSHPLLRGTADRSHRFWARALDATAPKGRVGLILPRATLSAPAVEPLRRSLSITDAPRRPIHIFSDDRGNLFPEAQVYVCSIIVGPDEPSCTVGVGPDPTVLDKPEWRSVKLRSANWWAGIHGDDVPGKAAVPTAPAQPTMGDKFEIAASLTATEAYAAAPYMIDLETDDGSGALRWITTGLIDPGELLWGERTCRYLHERYDFPRIAVPPGADVPASLKRRLDKARRPKVIVAGLAKKVEAAIDEAGDCSGAVSTFSIFHPKDDVEELRQVVAYLSRDEISVRFERELGGNAMGGGNITMRKSWLQSLPWPAK